MPRRFRVACILCATYGLHKRFVSTDNEKQFCRDYTTSAMAYLRRPIQRKKLEDDPQYRNTFSQCLIPLMDMNCFITYISGSCEHGAGKMIFELIQKAGSVAEQCPASIRIDVIDLLNAFESATEEQIVPALNMNCFMTRTTLHSCGPGAKDIVLQMIIRMGGLEDQCIEPSREDVQELLKILTRDFLCHGFISEKMNISFNSYIYLIFQS
ncbi:hypothetical protein CEXT_520221 [Caerostris extrusa]|uniref:Uncharacterized protein n=1 Tax=Caerostris extrusa TaxID=172846 RepID=A0AAV4QY08_CAEEX|nr:hypothetical protein CEXT_520221 [Caerostris extrusa]